MSIFLPLFYILIFIFLIYNLSFFQIEGARKKTIAALFIIKVLCGIILSLIYKYYYKDDSGFDIYAFYNDGTKVFNAIYKNPLDYIKIITGIGSDSSYFEQYYATSEYWNKLFNYNLYNDNRILIRFNAVISLFSFGYYYVHVVFMTFISFIGLVSIYKTFIPFLQTKKTELIICVFLIPSVLIWTSGILKESIVIFAFGIFIYSFFNLVYHKISLKFLILFMIGTGLLILSKFYYLLAALPGLISLLISKKWQKHNTISFVLSHVVFFLILYFSKYIDVNFDFVDIITQKQNDFINMVQLTGGSGSYIDIQKLDGSIYSIFKNSFYAFTNTLFRPFLSDIKSTIMIPAAVENCFIIISILVFLIFAGYRKMIEKEVFFSMLSFVIILFTLFGIITPVLGSLVRYRAPVLPFLFIALLLLFDKEKFKNSQFYKKFKELINLK